MAKKNEATDLTLVAGIETADGLVAGNVKLDRFFSNDIVNEELAILALAPAEREKLHAGWNSTEAIAEMQGQIYSHGWSEAVKSFHIARQKAFEVGIQLVYYFEMVQSRRKADGKEAMTAIEFVGRHLEPSNYRKDFPNRSCWNVNEKGELLFPEDATMHFRKQSFVNDYNPYYQAYVNTKREADKFIKGILSARLLTQRKLALMELQTNATKALENPETRQALAEVAMRVPGILPAAAEALALNPDRIEAGEAKKLAVKPEEAAKLETAIADLNKAISEATAHPQTAPKGDKLTSTSTSGSQGRGEGAKDVAPLVADVITHSRVCLFAEVLPLYEKRDKDTTQKWYGYGKACTDVDILSKAVMTYAVSEIFSILGLKKSDKALSLSNEAYLAERKKIVDALNAADVK